MIASVCVFFTKLPKNIEVYTMGEYVELAKICVGQYEVLAVNIFLALVEKRGYASFTTRYSILG